MGARARNEVARRKSSKTKHHNEHMARAARKTHQSDRAEAVKYLRDAADVLKGGGEARREEKERRAQHMSSEKKYIKINAQN
jgi:hypothetical protein